MFPCTPVPARIRITDRGGAMSAATGFHKVGVHGTDWRQDAVCTQFPTAWADRLWLYEDAASDDKPDRNLRITARMVCSECPVRIQCLASATVDGEKHGIRGGFRQRERLLAAEIAERDGLVIFSRTGANRRDRYERYAAWLMQHQEIFESVPQQEQREATARRRRKAAAEKTRRPVRQACRRGEGRPVMQPIVNAFPLSGSGNAVIQQQLF